MPVKSIPLFHTFKEHMAALDSQYFQLTAIPVAIVLQVEVDSESDQKVLIDLITDLFQKFVQIQETNLKREVRNLNNSFQGRIRKWKVNNQIAIAEKKEIVDLERTCRNSNKVLEDQFQNWQIGLIKEVDAIVDDWSKRNQRAAIVQGKRAANIAKDVVIITKGAVTTVTPKGVINVGKAVKDLYDQLRNAVDGIDKKLAKVEKEADKLWDHIEALEKNTFKSTLLKWKDKVSSCTEDLEKAMKIYQDSITSLESAQKKLGAEVKRLEKEHKNQPFPKLAESRDKLAAIGNSLELHTKTLSTGKVAVAKKILEFELKSLKEQATDKVRKTAAKACQKVIRKLTSDLQRHDLSKLKKVVLDPIKIVSFELTETGGEMQQKVIIKLK